MQKNIVKTRVLASAAVLIAFNIVIVRFVSVQTATIRISLGFAATSLCSMLFGPMVGGISAFAADFLGMIINSRGMAYFPGFGISEALYGVTYGLFLYKKEKSYKNIILCVTLQTAFIDLGLGTLWVYIMTHNPVWTIFLTRLVNSAVLYPIKIFGIKYIWKYVGKRFESRV